jgi:hypothetical protein
MRCRRALIIFSCALLWSAAPARAAIITFDSVTVSPGSSFSLEIRVDDALDLYTFGFDLVFDPSVVALMSVEAGDIFSNVLGACSDDGLSGDCFFFPGIPPSDADGEAGVIRSISNTLYGDATGVTGGLLATITFQALASGPANISILDGVFLLNSVFLEEEPTTIANGTVTIEAPAGVPEPSTLLLTGLGLAALVRRRFRRC